MVTPQLLEMLVCPESRQSLQSAGSDLLGRVNRAIHAGGVLNRGGQPVNEPISAGLVRSDGRILYIVREEIPIMLVDEAIALDQLSTG